MSSVADGANIATRSYPPADLFKRVMGLGPQSDGATTSSIASSASSDNHAADEDGEGHVRKRRRRTARVASTSGASAAAEPEDDASADAGRRLLQAASLQVSRSTTTVDRALIDRAVAIAQVERKFVIATAVNDDATRASHSGESAPLPRQTLLCIDQHAADERVKLEGLERQLDEVSRCPAAADGHDTLKR